ncbi:MAG TPA: hypothetical protein IAA20_05075 [Candidatus Enterococcus avicola]|uniref:DUF536 domain-containing protein n=2 Tax=Lactobacillales TaxID=186826 RepID=A0A921FD94_9LACO|nr:hypothetical protein [Candidatus Enterococcus avicola]HJE98343.1 hypothetical protein [Ligilactobacillus acidipiscis]
MADDIYTITRLADELQKTRQNVRRRIKKLDIKALNEDTRVYQTEPLEYDKVTYLKLAESFGISVCNTNDISNDVADDIVKDELIEVLKDQLKVANEEKKELRRLLDQQQQLNLSDRNRVERLELELEDTTEEKAEKKKGWFSRWFGS